MKPRYRIGLIGLLGMLFACAEDVPGIVPPADQLYFPYGSVVIDDTYLVVASTNLDQRYNAGRLHVFSTAELARVVEAPAPPSDCEDVPFGVRFCDSFAGAQVGSIRIDGFAGDIVSLGASSSGPEGRVVVVSRGHNLLTWVDIQAGGIPSCGVTGLSNEDIDDENYPLFYDRRYDCSRGHMLGTRLDTRGNDPFALAFAPASNAGGPGFLFASHLRADETGLIEQFVTTVGLEQFEERISLEQSLFEGLGQSSGERRLALASPGSLAPSSREEDLVDDITASRLQCFAGCCANREDVGACVASIEASTLSTDQACIAECNDVLVDADFALPFQILGISGVNSAGFVPPGFLGVDSTATVQGEQPLGALLTMQRTTIGSAPLELSAFAAGYTEDDRELYLRARVTSPGPQIITDTQARINLNVATNAIESRGFVTWTGTTAISGGQSVARAYVSLRFQETADSFNSGLAVIDMTGTEMTLVGLVEVGEELGAPSSVLTIGGRRLLYVPDMRADKVYIVDVTSDRPIVVGKINGRANREVRGDVIGARTLDSPSRISFATVGDRRYGFVTNFSNSTIAVLDLSDADSRRHRLVARIGQDIDAEGEREGF